MRSRLSLNLALITLTGFASSSALAVGCVPTAEQEGFLAGIELNIPEGEVPIIMRCDTNGDEMVDIVDIRAIMLQRNQPAAHPDDPLDWDGNNIINILDARGCQQACGEARCAIRTEPPGEPEGVPEVAECFQAEDTDNDGEVDQLVAVTENVPEGGGSGEGEKRSLGVVLLQKDEAGEVKAIKDSYAGKTREGTVDLHLSKIEAGEVNLGPGTKVVLDKPATVAYQDGRPKTLYYVEDGKLRRAAFGVDD